LKVGMQKELHSIAMNTLLTGIEKPNLVNICFKKRKSKNEKDISNF
tara:strand:- start:2123 stop:2260 length:138 start_codon:yes stop_codon:yes gene_type:complete